MVLNSIPHIKKLCSDDHVLHVDFNETFNMYTLSAPQRLFPAGSPVAHMETGHQVSSQLDNAFYHSHNAIALYNVDRFKYGVLSDADFYFVYIHNFPRNNPGGSYFPRVCRLSGQITIH